MHRPVLLFLFLFVMPGNVMPQPKVFARADSVALAAPDSAALSVTRLAGYFGSELSSKEELIRAFYVWCGHNIAYDADNMYTFRTVDNPGQLVIETLIKRKAVCQGYAAVFHELCQISGIESYIVLGFTRQNGTVVNVNHAWVAARPKDEWRLYDPTWAAGIISEGAFVPRFTNEYFQPDPARFIKTHMPFDPIWQCLYYPYSPALFYSQQPPGKTLENHFSYPDSIAAYLALPKEERLRQTLRRVDQNGIVNNAIGEYRRYLQQSIEVDRLNKESMLVNDQVNRFNEAVNHYNSAAYLFNDYVNYWNRQFKPMKQETEIRQMVDTCAALLSNSRDILAGLQVRDESLIRNMDILSGSIRELSAKVGEQKEFLREYFATPKMMRPTLFKNYRPQ